MQDEARQTVSFGRDIRPLFTETDREEMLWAFDLYSPDDVREHSATILDRLQLGDMPCDNRWPERRVELFERWIHAGMPD
jgi:hypothetical protein